MATIQRPALMSRARRRPPRPTLVREEPLLSNIVLDELDCELARRGHRFVRYADDANVYVASERAGHRVMASLERFIEGRLRLKIGRGPG